MNSDPYDSAAWRTFGMLDADESAIFDEAMRHDPVLQTAYLEMDRLCAAIAASAVQPIAPRAGQLERLQVRLNLNPSRRAHLWIGISGWAAAAVLAMILVLDRTGTLGKSDKATVATSQTQPLPQAPSTTPEKSTQPTETVPAIAKQTDKPENQTGESTHIVVKEPDVKATVKVETKRLVQEIAVLRENLEKFQHRDRVLFEAVPGMALPIVMTMNPPGSVQEDTAALAKNELHSPITAMLGDAVKGMNVRASANQVMDPALVVQNTNDLVVQNTNDLAAANPGVAPSGNLTDVAPDETTETPKTPSAIPIYDAARDSGTLVVNNLPAAAEGEVYNLWVNTVSGGRPIYVGSLPESSASGADSFDFSLGSTMVLPSGFVLTKDPLNSPVTPSAANTVLQGPPTPGR